MIQTDVVFVQPVVTLFAGIAILIWPQILNYIIAAFLILTGVLGLMPHLG